MKHPPVLCSLAPGYNVCILRGCSTYDLFVMVIDGRVELRRLLCLPSVLIL